QSPGNRRRKRQGQLRQGGDMQPAGQRRKDVEQRQDREDSDNRKRRPGGGPHSLPQQGAARQPHPPKEAVVLPKLTAQLPRGVQISHAAPRRRGASAGSPSQSGIVSRANIAS